MCSSLTGVFNEPRSDVSTKLKERIMSPQSTAKTAKRSLESIEEEPAWKTVHLPVINQKMWRSRASESKTVSHMKLKSKVETGLDSNIVIADDTEMIEPTPCSPNLTSDSKVTLSVEKDKPKIKPPQVQLEARSSISRKLYEYRCDWFKGGV